MADARDLKSLGTKVPCRFESGPRHSRCLIDLNQALQLASFFHQAITRLSTWAASRSLESEEENVTGSDVSRLISNAEAR